MKKYLRTSLMGALIGTVLVGWISPEIITWYFSPPVELAVTCKPAVEWGIHAYRTVMSVGALTGFLIATGFFVFFNLRKPKTQEKT